MVVHSRLRRESYGTSRAPRVIPFASLSLPRAGVLDNSSSSASRAARRMIFPVNNFSSRYREEKFAATA